MNENIAFNKMKGAAADLKRLENAHHERVNEVERPSYWLELLAQHLQNETQVNTDAVHLIDRIIGVVTVAGSAEANFEIAEILLNALAQQLAHVLGVQHTLAAEPA